MELLLQIAQEITLNGVVTAAEDGEPLPGVSVVVKGTTTGTVTDIDGQYELQVNPDANLQFSFIGMETQDVPVNGRTSINVQLQSSTIDVDEVVVIGYGTQKKEDVTGAVSMVNEETIENIKPVKVEQALQGTMAGVNVTTQSGAPGAGLDIRIRGVSTNGDASPVVIIDGYQGDLNTLSPNDIETITVLKDAQAAIYGTVGANGTILVTTKSGKRNTDTKVRVNSYVGMQETSRKLPVLNATEYAVLLNESYAASGRELPFTNISGLGRGTNWQNSMVLLKNRNHILPLSKEIGSLAIIGPLADAPHDQLGTWIFDGNEEDSETPKTTFQNLLGNRMHYATGLEYSRDKSTKGFGAALAAAGRSDAILFFAGEESILSGEANSRGIIDLPGIQTELLQKLKKTGKPLILIVMAGRPLAIQQELEMADAVLYAWHPGTMAGPAIADLVFGDYYPTGKLPVTFVKGAGQIPFYHYRKNTGRPAVKSDYTHIDDIPRNSKQLSLGFKSMHLDYGIEPLFPFGFGLSYTKFKYSNLTLSNEVLNNDNTISVSANVQNIGNFETDEIVQLYIRDRVGSITRPVKELKGFRKIHLMPGESKTVQFEIKPGDLEFFNGKEHVIEPGEFDVWIGPNSAEGLHTQFELR